MSCYDTNESTSVLGWLTGDLAPPRAQCVQYDPFVLDWAPLANAYIGLTYFLIPLGLWALWRYTKRRKVAEELPTGRWFVPALCLFILACGTGHLIDAGMFWRPRYRLKTIVDLVTAVANTAFLATFYGFTLRTLAAIETIRGSYHKERDDHHQTRMALEVIQRRLGRATEEFQAIGGQDDPTK